MRALIGVDLMGLYELGRDLLLGMDFESPEIRLINVVEPLLSQGGFPELSVGHPMAQILDDLRKAGESALEKAKQDWVLATTSVKFGFTVPILVEEANSYGADLVVVGCGRKSVLETMFAGSTTRGLAIESHTPLMIGKAETPPGKLSIVLAHDMSNYSENSIKRFVAMAPRGIEKITVVTAHHLEDATLTSDVQQAHEELKSVLGGLTSHVESIIMDGDATPVINEAMHQTGANCLVMGAHGHGFVERIFAGSTALHFAVKEPYNMILIRS